MKKPLAALAIVVVLMGLFTVCLVSATQLLSPRSMPFGVTGKSPVVEAVQSKYSLNVIMYSSASDLTQAAERGDIYGGYIPGSSQDTLITVPAKSFFGEIYVRGGFADAAKDSGRALETTVVAPLPTSDRTGALMGLLLVPTLISGYLITSMMLPFARTSTTWRRIAVVLGFAAVVAVITAAVGHFVAAIPWSATWALLPCFMLVTSAVALAALGLQALFGKLGTIVVAVAFIVVGGAGAGGGGVSLLPTYWQHIGALLPPRYAVELYRNVRYFDGNDIAIPIAVLCAYAIAGIVVALAVDKRRAVDPAGTITTAELPHTEPGRRRFVPKNLVAPVALSLMLAAFFAVNYTSSGHEPVADDMPFGVVGSSELIDAAQNDLFSLNPTEYTDEDSAKAAIARGEIYGALIIKNGQAEVLVVPSISDVAPLDITANFERAAQQAGEAIKVTSFTPTPLAPKDPFALVLATLLVPLLVGGYMATSLLTNALGTASARWRGLWFLGFAVVSGLVVDVIATFWLDGIPSDSFWIVWPIMSLIVVTVSLFAAVLRRLLGPIGILLTVIIFLQFGNPSSGGSNGSVYLTPFWRDLGPFLPPRNAYELLRDTVYFGGHGIGASLGVLLGYTVIAGVILAFLDWYKTPEVEISGLDADTTSSAAAVAVPVGPLP